MELHHLRHFLAVAEELNFRKAAERLTMAQPALSRSIQRLEFLLGTPLFHRTRTNVSLTTSGAYLVEEARFILNRADLAQRLTQRVGTADYIMIGIATPAWDEELTRKIRTFKHARPDIELRFTESSNKALLSGVRDGHFDLAFVMSPMSRPDGFQHRIVRRPRLLAAVSSSSRLAKRKCVGLKELAPYPFVTYSERIRTNNFSKLILMCQEAGFTPKFTHEVDQMHTLLQLVASGLGIALVDEVARVIRVKGITLLQVDGLDDLSLEVAAIWVPRMLPQPLKEFLALFDEAIA